MILSILSRSYFNISFREYENSLNLKWKRYCPEFYYASMLPSAGKIVQYLENESTEQLQCTSHYKQKHTLQSI